MNQQQDPVTGRPRTAWWKRKWVWEAAALAICYPFNDQISASIYNSAEWLLMHVNRYVLAIAAAVLGEALFKFKKFNQASYGRWERFFGFYAVLVAVENLRLRGASVPNALPLIAGMYVIARGHENQEAGEKAAIAVQTPYPSTPVSGK